MAEILGRAGPIGSQAVNCSAPDTGNMGKSPPVHLLFELITLLEVLARYGTKDQQQEWLIPLLNGEIRSAFAMTERFGGFL
jgi:acyl-CoA dehydrogenase